jgi:hypothetical protein
VCEEGQCAIAGCPRVVERCLEVAGRNRMVRELGKVCARGAIERFQGLDREPMELDRRGMVKPS